MGAEKQGEDRFFYCNGKRIEIRDVWADTLESEMDIIRSLADKHKYIAMVRARAERDFERIFRQLALAGTELGRPSIVPQCSICMVAPF